jgi:hypothetical protein
LVDLVVEEHLRQEHQLLVVEAVLVVVQVALEDLS